MCDDFFEIAEDNNKKENRKPYRGYAMVSLWSVFFPFLLIGWISCRRYCRQCCRRCCRCCCFNRITKSNLRPFCRCWRGNFLAVGSGYCFYGRLQRSYPRRKKTATSLRVHLFRSLFHVQKCVVFLLELKQLRQTGIHQTIR